MLKKKGTDTFIPWLDRTRSLEKTGHLHNCAIFFYKATLINLSCLLSFQLLPLNPGVALKQLILGT